MSWFLIYLGGAVGIGLLVRVLEIRYRGGRGFNDNGTSDAGMAAGWPVFLPLLAFGFAVWLIISAVEWAAQTLAGRAPRGEGRSPLRWLFPRRPAPKPERRGRHGRGLQR